VRSAGVIAERLAAVRDRVAAAAARAGRPGTVTLVAVSKLHPAAAVRAAFAAGAVDLGENYVQELTAKRAELADLPLRWHFIGRLQRNKVRDVAGKVALIHGVDSLLLLQEIGKRAAAAGVVQDLLIQVNVAGEEQKGGVAPDELPALTAACAALPALRLRGLMTMPPLVDDPERNRPHFRALAALARAHALAELSMGMSDDLEVAIEEGATLVRVGTAIFGARG
jgi:PLP dependent protein